MTPETSVISAGAWSIGATIGAFPMYRGLHGGLTGRLFATPGDTSGATQGRAYLGYAYWLLPSRLALFGSLGGGLVRFGGEAGKSLAVGGPDIGARWRFPWVGHLDASVGYDFGPTIAAPTFDPARTVPFTWSGVTARRRSLRDRRLAKPVSATEARGGRAAQGVS